MFNHLYCSFTLAPSSSASEGRSSVRPAADVRRQMRRKFGQPTLPNLYYKPADGILSVPGFTFERVRNPTFLCSPTFKVFVGPTMARHRQYDIHSRRQQPEGQLQYPRKDSLCAIEWVHVFGTRGSHVCVGMIVRLHVANPYFSLHRINSSADNPSLRLIDCFTIPKENGDVVVLLVYHPGPNLLGRYLPPSKASISSKSGSSIPSMA